MKGGRFWSERLGWDRLSWGCGGFVWGGNAFGKGFMYE